MCSYLHLLLSRKTYILFFRERRVRQRLEQLGVKVHAQMPNGEVSVQTLGFKPPTFDSQGANLLSHRAPY